MSAFIIALTIILSAAGYMATVPTACVPVTEAGVIACFGKVPDATDRL
jgi:hypothetical protein